jgi:hypothetical protein
VSTISQSMRWRPSASERTRSGRLFIFVLLVVVFEGAIRKWVASSASLPLILLRDMSALYLVFYVWTQGYLPRHRKLTALLVAWSCCLVAWAMLQVMLGQSNPLVLIIGLRFWLLYAWFGYAAAITMTESDYRAVIQLVCLILLLLAPLAVLQYYSPPNAFVNTEVDSVEGDVFVAIAGVVRTTGTFSFTSGYTIFLLVATPFALAVAGARKRTFKQILFAGTLFTAFVVSVVVSGSRTAVISSGFMLACYVIGELMFSRAANKGRAMVAAIALITLVVVFAFAFQGAVDTTQQRFEQASEAEDFGDRMVAMFIGEEYVYKNFTFLGEGVGLGSNLASFVRSGSTAFALAETETGRTLLEGGMLGYLYTALKLLVIFLGVSRSLIIAMRSGVILPLLIWLSFAQALLVWPSTGQLTANAMLGIFLCFALLSLRFPQMELFPRRSIPR